jgi:hypothetical protein
MAAVDMRAGRFLDVDFGSGGMTVARLSGRVAGVPRALGAPFLLGGRVLAGQVGCGMAWMRCQAVVIFSAQGQVAAIFRVLRRPPQTRRAAACRIR